MLFTFKEGLFLFSCSVFNVKNLETITFSWNTIVKWLIGPNYIPEKKNMRKHAEYYTIFSTSLWFLVVTRFAACLFSRLNRTTSFLPISRRVQVSLWHAVVPHASKIGNCLIIIYKTSENVLQQTKQAKVPKYKMRTEAKYAGKGISIVLGSSILSLQRWSDHKSQMKSGLECSNPCLTWFRGTDALSFCSTLLCLAGSCYLVVPEFDFGFCFFLSEITFFRGCFSFLFHVDGICLTSLSVCCFN